MVLFIKKDPIKANNYLFLTPIFGYLLAWLILKESITIYHLFGAILVIGGLLISGTMNIKDLLRSKTRSENIILFKVEIFDRSIQLNM